MIIDSVFFDVSPFYYDSREKCNLVRFDLGLSELFSNTLDDVDDHVNRATCDHCPTPVGWAAGVWRPLGLVLVHAGLSPWVLCPTCFATAKELQ